MLESILAKVHQALNRLGQSTDAASSSGSLNAKATDLRNNIVVANSGSIIKSIQRGVTAGSGNVTINAVNMNKAIILSKSKGSSGTVAATGSLSNMTLSGTLASNNTGNAIGTGTGQSQQINGTISGGSLSGGTTDLTVKEYSATLTNSTTINCDGPVEWQVIEYV